MFLRRPPPSDIVVAPSFFEDAHARFQELLQSFAQAGPAAEDAAICERERLFGALIEHAETQFRQEELIMHERAFPGADEHQRDHAGLLSDLRRRMGRFLIETDPAKLEAELPFLVDHLQKRIEEHAQELDMLFKPYVIDAG